MKTKFTIFIILIFNCSRLNSQVIYPIEFEGYQSKWTVIAGAVSDTVTYFWVKRPLIYNDDILFVSDIYGSYYNGYQVDKVSMNTGAKLWSTSFKTALNDRERVKNYFINSEKEFELLNMKEYKNDYWIWQKASFMKRTFDLDKGNELYSSFVDHSTVPMLLNWGPAINYPNLLRNTHILSKGNNYLYLDMFSYDTSFFHITEFNENDDILLDTMFTIEYIGKEKRVTSQNVGNRICYFWDTFKRDSINVHYSYFKRLDENVNFDVELDLTGKMDQADGFRLSFANDSFFIITSYHGLPWNGRIDYKDFSFYLFDMNGTKLDEIHIAKPDNVERFRPGVATVLNDSNKLLVINTYRDLDGIGQLNFVQSLQDSFIVLKSLTMVNNDFVDVDYITQITNGDILVGFGHFIFVENKEDPSMSYNTLRAEWKLFDVDDLLSSISEINDTQNRICAFIITPNPTADLIKITPNTKIQPNSIQIFNTIGQKIKSLPYQPTLDLSHFEKGIYFIQLHGGNGVDLGVQRVVVN